MNSIRNWLNSSRDYSSGATLYDVHGNDPALKRMFAQGYSSYRQGRLETALKALRGTADVVAITVPGKPEPIQLTIAPEDMPETRVKAEQDPYRDKWLPHYQRMNMLRHRLAGAASVQERGEMAFEILALEKKCKYWWVRRDYLIANGVPMPEEAATEKDPFVDSNELRKRLNTVRTYVSRYSKRCAARKTRPEDCEVLQQYIKEVKDLEAKLGI